MTFLRQFSCGLQPPALLFDNSQLKNLKLKNLAIYPSDFTTEASVGAVLSWANINFQPTGTEEKRVWQFQGAGYTDQKSVVITYTVDTPFNIGFEQPPSGVITTSELPDALNAFQVATITTRSIENKTIATITITAENPLRYFGYSILKSDHGCSGLEV